MSLLRTGPSADARSREVQYAGLPKSVKLWTVPQGNPGGVAATTLQFTNVLWNYGAYIVTFTGVNPTGITIPEPGLYRVDAFFETDRPSTPGIYINRNAIQDTTLPIMRQSMGTAGLGGGVSFSDIGQFAANDVLTLVYTYDTPLNTGYCALGVTKEGGQY